MIHEIRTCAWLDATRRNWKPTQPFSDKNRTQDSVCWQDKSFGDAL